MSRSLIRAAVLGSAVVMLAVSPVRAQTPALPDALELRIHGSNTIGAKLAPDIAKAMAAAKGLTGVVTKPGAKPEFFDIEAQKSESNQRYLFRFQAEGTGSAPIGLAQGKADVGMMSRPINDKEVVDTGVAGLGDLRAVGAENVIALDGLVVIVNKSNPVGALTIDQIARIFSGEIKNWSEVGGTAGAINIYARDNVSGTWDTFKSLVLDPGKRALVAGAKRFESSDDLSDSVGGDVQGIGFIGFAYIRGNKALKISTACGLQFTPEPFGVRAEEYPLSRRLYMYLPATRKNDAAAAYVRFALSEAAEPAVDQAGFISLKPERATAAYMLERGQLDRLKAATTDDAAPRLMDALAGEIKQAARLSTTFRFRTASSDLDSRAVEDVRRLADYLKKAKIDPQKIALFGFADIRGQFRRNLELSNARASQVAAELTRSGFAVPPANVRGFSVLAPVACSDGDNGLAKNRRVEVWVRG